jgi:hypothetical protein
VSRDITTDVQRCARCRGTHEDHLFRPFRKPVLECGHRVLATHWAICPGTGEPILMLASETVS